jgi:hypothetical protein
VSIVLKSGIIRACTRITLPFRINSFEGTRKAKKKWEDNIDMNVAGLEIEGGNFPIPLRTALLKLVAVAV